jgi:choline kinase
VIGVVLAAGRGSRLHPDVDGPKCLAPVGGEPLVARQIRLLRQAGVDDIAVVVGCDAARVARACGRGVRFVENARFAQTNSLYSLWLARPLLRDGFLVLNCDVLFHPRLLDDLLETPWPNALLVAPREPLGPPYGTEEMKVRLRGACVVDIAKSIPSEDADGENVGIARFDAPDALRLVAVMDRLVAAGHATDWAPRAFREFAAERPLYAVGTRGLPWIEIDFPDDYRSAIDEILPRIEGGDVRQRPDGPESDITEPDTTWMAVS